LFAIREHITVRDPDRSNLVRRKGRAPGPDSPPTMTQSMPRSFYDKLMHMTPKEFVESAPLYTRINLNSFRPPDSITRMCDQADCKRETTWFKLGKTRTTTEGANPNITVEHVSYECGLCKSSSLGVIYELLDWSIDGNGPHYSNKAVRKVGQVPAPEISIAPELTERLGSSAIFYKNALILRQFNYGIGAVAYLRRVVDLHTDNLIDIMIDLSRTSGVAEEEIQQLQETKTETQYKEKLKIASELVPQRLRPGDVNPLGQLYKHTSIGLHNKSDDECIKIFDDLKEDFEYVFKNLHLQAEEQKQFAARIKERAGRSQE
jgi:hypothetical protein